MEQEIVVRRRRWLDRRQFLDAFAAINFIPGPNSTELAIYLGSVRAGFAGLVTAGFCFIVPAVLIILPIAWAYARYGQIVQVRGMMGGVNAACRRGDRGDRRALRFGKDGDSQFV